MRLQKYMAHCGVASRRKCEELILQSRVRVNGKIISEPGTQVNEGDIVELDGDKLVLEEELKYIALNKPKGCVTTSKDQFDRKTVLDCIDVPYRVYPVGRLDYDTTGLLILTNDGELANKLTHPRYEKEKQYQVRVNGKITPELTNAFKNGIIIDGRKTLPVELHEIEETEGYTEFKVVLKEGRNRQIRRTCEAGGKKVLELTRLSFGGIQLKDLKPGQWRELTEKEINALKRTGDKNGK